MAKEPLVSVSGRSESPESSSPLILTVRPARLMERLLQKVRYGCKSQGLRVKHIISVLGRGKDDKGVETEH